MNDNKNDFSIVNYEELMKGKISERIDTLDVLQSFKEAALSSMKKNFHNLDYVEICKRDVIAVDDATSIIKHYRRLYND